MSLIADSGYPLLPVNEIVIQRYMYESMSIFHPVKNQFIIVGTEDNTAINIALTMSAGRVTYNQTLLL